MGAAKGEMSTHQTAPGVPKNMLSEKKDERPLNYGRERYVTRWRKTEYLFGRSPGIGCALKNNKPVPGGGLI